ncbi:hypothetical protein GCM10010440_73430 [Kitasatospora cinereorecta]
MLINGFDDGPLVAGEELVARPGFWAAYLMWLCQPEECEYPPTPKCFGADPADVDAVSKALDNEDSRPVFRIPFGGGHTALVLNRPFEPGTQYLITHPDWGRHGHLTTITGPDATGPGLFRHHPGVAGRARSPVGACRPSAPRTGPGCEKHAGSPPGGRSYCRP